MIQFNYTKINCATGNDLGWSRHHLHIDRFPTSSSSVISASLSSLKRFSREPQHHMCIAASLYGQAASKGPRASQGSSQGRRGMAGAPARSWANPFKGPARGAREG